jgi:hypothetical protein
MSFFGAVLGGMAGAKSVEEADEPDLGGQVGEIVGDVYDPSTEFE